MHDKKKAYYRNYYQENLARTESQYDGQQMRPYSTVDATHYRANHQQQHYSRQTKRPKDTMELSFNTESTGSDLFRGLALGLPLFIGVIVVLYATGLFNTPTVEQTLVTALGETSVSYLNDYKTLVTAQNEMNELITTNIARNDFSPLVQTELMNYTTEIQTVTKQLETYEVAEFNRLSSLFELNLLSNNAIVEAMKQPNVTTTSIQTVYTQFIQDQNSVGKQITEELESVLTEVEIIVEKVMGGKLELDLK